MSDAASHKLRGHGDRVLLPVGAGVITQLQLDFAFGFTIEARLYVRIEEAILVEGVAGRIACEPGDPESISPLLDLHQAVVTEAAAGKDGSLTVVLADGRTPACRPGDHCEAFTITGDATIASSWVFEYNTKRPHRALDGRTPLERSRLVSGRSAAGPRSPRVMHPLSTLGRRLALLR